MNTLRLARHPMETLLGWRRRYGDVFTVRYLVFGTGVYVADPDAIRDLMTGDQSDLHAGEANAPLSTLVGEHSFLVLDGARHLRQRKLLLPPFQGSAVQTFRAVIREVAEAEVSAWQTGAEFALQDRMRALTLEVICRAIFGFADPDRVERLRSAFAALVKVGPAFYLPGPLQRDLGPFSPWGQVRRRVGVLDKFVYEEIARRRSEPHLGQRTDVLSILLGARDEDGLPMSEVELRDELVTMLAAGHETTATALAFAFDLLLHNPRVLTRLRDELNTGDDAFLDAVATETLRLRPVIDANERTLTMPRVVAGWELPAGIRVYPAIALVQRRGDLYPRAEEFRPERFLEEDVESYAWFPFGGGIRRCIGAALAQAEMSEVIRVVVSRANLRAVRPEPDPVVMRSITLIPRYGTRVTVEGVAP